jgi:hypothetical protein
MALPSMPKREPRQVSVTIRLSKRSADQLKMLAKEHNLSQADVVEYLLDYEYANYQKRKPLMTAAESQTNKKMK